MRPIHLAGVIVSLSVSLSGIGVNVGAIAPPPASAPAKKALAPAKSALPRSTPESQGVSSAALLGFVDDAEQKLDALHSIMVVRHGQVVMEGWWSPYAANEPHMLFSLSKSFTSTAVGLAIADGKLTVEDPVLRFFPDEAPAEPSANLKAMRVRDLLTMSTGHHEEDIRDFPFQSDESLVKKFLSLPVPHKPGTFFFYNTPATYILSAIVQKVTGQTVLEYLRPRLFDPLGFENPVWDASKQGISLGGFGLNARTEEIARFGQLYLQKGMWQGKQLVPAAWVEDATSRHMSNGSSPTSDWEQGYGYQFWRCRHGFYRGDGAHGQFCIVMPQYDAVVAITSGTRDMGSVMNLVWDRIVPALKPAALPADRAAHDKLTAKLATLVLKPQTDTASTAGASPASSIVASAAGKRYVFEKNPESIEAITLDPPAAAANGETAFTLRINGADQHLTAAPGAWRKGTLTLQGVETPIAASGGWTADDTYTLKIARYRTPFAVTYKLRFAGERLIVESEQNVGAADKRIASFTGALSTGSR
jgi:CubicO group peptidase (beta-lactamase class C family)